MSVCENKEAFQPLITIASNDALLGPKNTLKDDINEASILYNNAKFYYANNEFNGALVSYSCAAVLLNSIDRQLQQIRKPSSSSSSSSSSLSDNPILQQANNASYDLLHCCLNAVEVLQGKVKTGSSSAGGSKDNEKKDWSKICTNLQPLVFSKGSSDCLFFSSVAGLRKEKELFRTSLIFPLSYPNLYPKASKGILIYGPPGTGKTYIVKAAVNELQKTDPNVGVLFFAPSPGDLKGKYVGETEKKIEEWFTCASRAACESQLNCPGEKKFISLIFMDEFDAIAPDRSQDNTGMAANSVNTLLQMMDGINSKENVAVVAATNYPWDLDSAILRRFDTQILIDLPKKNDIAELLNIEMKKIIKFREVKVPNAFCLAEEKKYSTTTTNTPLNTKTGSNCTLECVEEPPTDLTIMPPYNQMIFDYYDISSNSGTIIAGIISKLEEKNFSNSDVSRLIKAAATYTGQLCVKNNLFYSSRMLGNYTGSENFISTITKLKDDKKAIATSIAILKSYLEPNMSFPENIYQLTKPKFVKVEYNNETFINVKCFFYKDNELNLDDSLIKDIYIKFNVADVNNITEEEYRNQIMKKRVFDAILTFDFSIKESNSANADNSLMLPVSNILINSTFKPMYNIFQTVKKTIEDYSKTGQAGGGQEEAKAWAKKVYNLTDAEITSIETGKMFNVVNGPGSFFTDGLKRILNNTNVGVIKGEAAKMINSFNANNYTFYSYILLHKLINNLNATTTMGYNIILYLQSIGNYDKLVNLSNEDDLSNLGDPFSASPQPVGSNITKNITDFLPFTIIYLNTNSEISVYYNKDENTLFLTIEQYKSLIPNFEAFNSLNLFTQNQPTNVENKYIKINVQLFELLFNKIINIDVFKTVYREKTGTQFIPKAFDPKLDYSNKDQVLIQLYLNDIFNFYELCKLRLDNKAQEYLNGYLNGYLNMKKYEQINTGSANVSTMNVSSVAYYTYTIPILELICMRIFNNFIYVKYDKIFVLNKTDTNQDVTIGEYQSLFEKKAAPTTTGLTSTNAPIATVSSSSSTIPANINANQPPTGARVVSAYQTPQSSPIQSDWEYETIFDQDTGAVPTGFRINKKLGIKYNKDTNKIRDNDNNTINYNNLTQEQKDAIDSLTKSNGGGTAKNRKANSHNKTAKNKLAKAESAKKKKQSKRLLRNKKAQGFEEEFELQYGGAPEDDIEKSFISFSLNNSVTEVVKKIVNKKIYIKTQIDLDQFIQQKRNTYTNKLTTMFTSYAKTWKDFFMNKTQQQIQAEKETITKAMVEDLKRKNLYLPLVFKEISAIGFLTEQNATSVKDDDDILENVKIEWIEISKSVVMQNIFNALEKVFLGYTVGIPVASAAATAGIGLLDSYFGIGIGSLISTIINNSNATDIASTTITSSNATEMLSNTTGVIDTPIVLEVLNNVTDTATATTITSTAIDTAAASTGLFSWLTWAAIAYAGYDIFQSFQDPNTATVLNSFALKTIFSKITDERYITVPTLEGKKAVNLFIESLNLDFLKGMRDAEGFFNKARAVTTSVYSSLTENININTKENPNQYGITKYDKEMTEPADIRRKLTNLNIPFTAFYYALSVVQSTYVKDTGEMLQLYYSNKDKFMEDYKKKKRGK
jgi:SpoVK/Ycf46/Vps4 family AAA+-type ATPase